MLRFNLALAIAPALLLFWLFQRWDAKRPEPLGAVRNMLLLGIGTVVPSILVELVLSYALGDELVSAHGGLVNAFVVAALTEEFFKLAAVLVFLWRKPHFDEVMDGILYTAAASLGFAVIENVLYSAGNPITGFMRAFTAVPMHAACSAIMGYFVGRGKLSRGSAVPWILAGLGAGVAIHGAYDWALFSGGTFGLGAPGSWQGLVYAFGIVVAASLMVLVLVKHALKLDDAQHGPNSRPLFPRPQPGPQQPYPYPYPNASQQPYYPHTVQQQPYYPNTAQQQAYPYGNTQQQPYPYDNTQQQQPYPYPNQAQQQPYPYPSSGQPQQQPYPYPSSGHPQPQQPHPYANTPQPGVAPTPGTPMSAPLPPKR
jgi:RsiW-degrading membrane proteinase PrsW (M82 family)